MLVFRVVILGFWGVWWFECSLKKAPPFILINRPINGGPGVERLPKVSGAGKPMDSRTYQTAQLFLFVHMVDVKENNSKN